jgi:hypothetical protein
MRESVHKRESVHNNDASGRGGCWARVVGGVAVLGGGVGGREKGVDVSSWIGRFNESRAHPRSLANPEA